MAEETLSPLQTPEIITKATKQEGAKSRRNSATKVISSSNTGDKDLPRYLRASTGSCHDFCKYGRKDASEGSPRHPTLKKYIKKLRDEKNGGENLVLLPQMKKSVPKKSLVAYSGIFSDYNSEIIKREALKSPSGDSDGLKREMPIKSPGGITSVLNKDSLVKKKKKKAPTFKPVSLPVDSVPESQTLKNTNLRKQETLPSSKAVAGQASSKAKETILSSKRFASLNQKSVVDRPKDNGVKTEGKSRTSKVVPKKVPINPRASLSTKSSLRISGNGKPRKIQGLKVDFAPKNQKLNNAKSNYEAKQANGDPVHEKTLYVVETEAENNKVMESDQKEILVLESAPPPSSSSTQKEEDEQESAYTVTEPEEDYEYPSESIENESAEEKGENKSRQRRKGSLSAEDRTVKLSFRRGKVVDVLSEDDTPRRLKFRRGKAFVENQKLKGDGRISYTARSDEGDANGENSSEGEKVVLRHQEVQDRKDAQGLFNVVIEEAASKLVETRKSKVKALVGAFETVISLQETKPSGNASP